MKGVGQSDLSTSNYPDSVSKAKTSNHQLSEETSQMNKLSDKGALELQCGQDSSGDSSEGISADDLTGEELVSQCKNWDQLTNDQKLLRIVKHRELSGRKNNHKTETNKEPESQAQEHHQRDTNEFRDNILGTLNNLDDLGQDKMDTNQEATDNNNSSNSEVGHDGVNGCSPSDEISNQQQKDHQLGDQQTVQDSDLSPSHSSNSAKTNNDNDDPIKEHDQLNCSSMGRNRRVRQKNRYFNDFHCMQLVKGCRSRDDYDAYSPSTSATRSSNRRSTTDSSRNSPGTTNPPNEKPPVKMISFKDLFHDKYCRKCGAVKPHDENNKCQICLYDEIISAEKRRKASLRSSSKAKSKSKSKTKSPVKKSSMKEEKADQAKAQVDISPEPTEPTQGSNHEESFDGHQQTVDSITIRHEQATKSQTPDSQKRKWVVKPGKSQNDENVFSICREIDPSNQNDSEQRETNDEPKRKVIIKTAGEQSDVNMMIDDISTRSSSSDSTSAQGSKSIDSDAINNAGDNYVDNQEGHMASVKPDTWTSEQVAQYVSSKGFASESNLFREQDVDGISLLMMKRQDFTYGLKMKLGPALKLYEQVCRLRRDYDQEAAIAS